VFIQVIHGKTSHRDELRRLAESWQEEGGVGAVGYLGGTFGVTEGGDFLGVVRFASRDEAMANSARPETTAFAEKMAELMDGPVQFHDCGDVTTFLEGGSDDAGFVQVMRGHLDDPTRAKEMMADTGDELQKMRPEIIGGTFAISDDQTYFQTVYFTDEASARRGEQTEPPEEIRAELESMMAGATFYDLTEPWFTSA